MVGGGGERALRTLRNGFGWAAEANVGVVFREFFKGPLHGNSIIAHWACDSYVPFIM